MFEAFVAVSSPFAWDETRASFLGKPPGTLEEILGVPFDVGVVRAAIEEAYLSSYALEPREASALSGPRRGDPRASPRWSATAREAIGEVAAGLDELGKMRVGGDLLVSRDALARLEARLDDLPRNASKIEVETLVDDTLAAPGVVVHGVRKLATLADVILRARAQKRA